MTGTRGNAHLEQSDTLMSPSMVSAETSHRKIFQRTVICSATKDTLQALYSGNIGTTWMAGFLGLSKFDVTSVSATDTHPRPRVRLVSLRGLSREHKPSWKQGVISPYPCQLGQKYRVL